MGTPGLPPGGDPGSLPINPLGAPVGAVCQTCGGSKCSCDVPPLPRFNALRSGLPAGVGGSVRASSAVPSGVSYSIDSGTVQLDRADQFQSLAARVGITLPQFPIPGECSDPSGPCGVDESAREPGPPACDAGQRRLCAQLVLTYNSTTAGTPGEFGYGWCCNYNWKIAVGGLGPLVTDGIGTELQYTGSPSVGGLYTPPAGAVDSLQLTASGYALLQPGGMTLIFDSSGNLTSLQNNAGTWTISRTSGLVTGILDPGGGHTTLTYSSGTIRSIIDPADRTMTLTVDGNGNLTQAISPAG